MDAQNRLSRLFIGAAPGDARVINEALPLVYRELRSLASGYLARERADHTLQPTALVHETYLRLVGDCRVAWQNRAHFLGIAARAMRQILVKHARAQRAIKRGGNDVTLVFNEAAVATREPSIEVLALEEALTSLKDLDRRLCQVVELRFFAGLTIQETAEVVGVSASTIERDWSMARAWLHREVGRG